MKKKTRQIERLQAHHIVSMFFLIRKIFVERTIVGGMFCYD